MDVTVEASEPSLVETVSMNANVTVKKGRPVHVDNVQLNGKNRVETNASVSFVAASTSTRRTGIKRDPN